MAILATKKWQHIRLYFICAYKESNIHEIVTEITFFALLHTKRNMKILRGVRELKATRCLKWLKKVNRRCFWQIGLVSRSINQGLLQVKIGVVLLPLYKITITKNGPFHKIKILKCAPSQIIIHKNCPF